MTRSLIILIAVIALPAFGQGIGKIIMPCRDDPVIQSDSVDSRPSNEQIKEWWFPRRTWKEMKELEIDKTERIGLKGGEEAFLCHVGFPDRPRNFLRCGLLVRTLLKEAREIPELWQEFKVYDLDNDGVSEVVSWGYSTQTETIGWKSILHFDGWIPVTLYKKEFGDNLDICGKEFIGRTCYGEDVVWAFTYLNRDNTMDLLELIIYWEGDEQDQVKWSTKLNTYLLKGKQFVPSNPDLKLSNMMKRADQERISSFSDPASPNLNSQAFGIGVFAEGFAPKIWVPRQGLSTR